MEGDIINQAWSQVTHNLQQQLRQQSQMPQFDPFLSQALQLARSLMRSVATTSDPINIEDAKSVTVGEVYLVNVIRGKDLELDLPVLGPLHDDCEVPEMNAAFNHWHIDWRFVPDLLYQVITRAFGKASGGVMEDLLLLLMNMTLPASSSSEPQRRALRCVRPHSHFKATAQAWLAALEKVNEGKRACNNICPHRGFSLVGAVEDANGVRLCPGHGLAWNKQGELVRQTT
jgi:nitrite reductase/ring-hydroxylating ferredoxin subunit